jgi:Transglutaminase-like superfamily
MSFDELPDAGADLVQPEVRPRIEVQDDGLSVQIAEHGVLAQDERVFERDCAHIDGCYPEMADEYTVPRRSPPLQGWMARRAITGTLVIPLYRRFVLLGRADRRLLIEAASLMAVVWAGLRLIRFRALLRMLDWYTGPPSPRVPESSSGVPVRVGWAIKAVARRFPAATCLVQALAADALLRRRGFASRVRIGVRIDRRGERPLEGHAWIECQGAVSIGAVEDLSDFKALAAMEAR